MTITLGDPHLGRKFRTGVPLHRIGEREASVWSDFRKSLRAHNGDIHVNMGDLFDKFVVAPEVVLRAAEEYHSAAKDLPSCTFYVMRGNHDVSRDSTKASSFDIFSQLVANIPNIVVINEVTMVNLMAFIPYDPFTPVAETIEQLPADLEQVFMHHDFVDFGGDQVIPTELLASKGIMVVTNGHDHLKRTEKRHGVTVEMVGSMQPYSHAEDPEGTLYKTVKLEELEGLDTEMLNVRVLLKEGEVIPEDINALSITAKRLDPGQEDDVNVDTEDFEAFDIGQALAEAVHPDVRDAIMEKFNA